MTWASLLVGAPNEQALTGFEEQITGSVMDLKNTTMLRRKSSVGIAIAGTMAQVLLAQGDNRTERYCWWQV
jgi:hypothetical protein